MVRTMLESLISDRNTKGKKSLRKGLEEEHIAKIEEFHKESFYWSYLLNFTGNNNYKTVIKILYNAYF